MTAPLRPAAPTSLGATTPDAAAQRASLRTAAQQFEAVFLRQMIGSMRSAHLGDDLFGSQATEQFRDMSDASLADSMSHQGVFGIAQLLLGQFGRQAAGSATASATTGATPANPDAATVGASR